MKKKIATLLVAMLVLLPKTSHADLDVLSIIQDLIKTYQEKANTLIQNYIGLQVNLQELTLNRDIVTNLKNTVKSQLESKAAGLLDDVKNMAWEGATEFTNSQLSAVTLPGINNSISYGPYTSPVMKQKVGKSYMKRTNIKNDVQVTKAQDLRNNKLLVENLAIIYANALVTRKKMMLEEEEEEADDSGAGEETEGTNNPDVSTIQFRYGQVSRHAAYLWMQTLRFDAAYRKAFSEMRITEDRQDDISEIIGEDENNVDTSELEDIGADFEKMRTSVDIKALHDKWKSGTEALKNGDYAGVLNTAAEAYGIGAVEGNQDISNMVQTGARGVGDAINNTKNGNYSGLSTGVGNTVGDMLGGNTGQGVSAIGDMVGGGIDLGNSKGKDANEIFDNVMQNGGIQSGLGKLGGLDPQAQNSGNTTTGKE